MNKLLLFWILIIALSANIALAAGNLANDMPISAEFNDMEIKSVLSFVAKQLNLNLYVAKEVKGTVTISFKQLPISKVLELVVENNDFSWRIEDNLLVVDNSLQSQSFFLKRLNAKDAQDMLETILREQKLQIQADEQNNALVIRALPRTLKQIAKVLADFDLMPLQAMVEVKIMDITLSDTRKLGTNLDYPKDSDGNRAVTTGLATPLASGTTGFFARAIDNNLQIDVEALQTNANTNILASPRLTVMNHKPAKLITGSRYGYTVTTTTAASTSEGVEFLEVGTKLTFTPHISTDGYIRMQIKPEVSEGSIVNNLPQESTTETETEVIVKDGQSIIIGGLLKNSDNYSISGIPILMDIPLLGYIFRTTTHTKRQSELVVVITPHILRENYDLYNQEAKDALNNGVAKKATPLL